MDIKKAIRIYLILGMVITINLKSANAQLAKQNLPVEEISQTLRELASKEDPASKKEFQKELRALEQANNESYNNLAARIYRFLGDTTKSDIITSQLAKKYPRGHAARDEARNVLFAKDYQSIDEKLEAYQQWLSDFPMASNESLNDKIVYMYSAFQIAKELISEGKADKLPELARLFANTIEYYEMVSRWSSDLYKAGQVNESLPLLRQAVEKLGKDEGHNRYRNVIMSSYAKALIYLNEYQAGIEILKDIIDHSPQVNVDEAMLLAEGYMQLGRNLDAFKVLEDFLINQSSQEHEAVFDTIELLYHKLNNHKGDYEGYKASIDGRIAQMVETKYREELIEEKAPDFELVNMHGETVRLEDFRGKILILDFWATWCGPCIVSFPGMQAAVDKYKDDPEVEFLFINTLQNPEENYQKQVEEFIAEHEYTFHVVYDEMIDRSQSTATAFGVTGIPTKIFIDQNGMIRFVSVGGNANVEDVVNEIDAKIRLLREVNSTE